MARLITKFKYLKPDERNHFGGYAEYIATREGVEKIDESKRLAPATDKQRQLIKQILSDFPDSRSSLEYEDYRKEKTVGAASEFITRTLEENADEMLHTKTYADYIATRPRAERFGSHGLFTDDGVAVDLQKVSGELNAHTGNVWTAIVSLRREDAERLGFDTGTRWRDMLRSQAQTLSENLRIKLFFKWGIEFDKDNPYAVPDQGNREVKYADKKEIQDGILEKYPPQWTEEVKPQTDTDGGQAQQDSQKHEPQKTPPHGSRRNGNPPIRTSPPKKETAPGSTEAEIIKDLAETEEQTHEPT